MTPEESKQQLQEILISLGAQPEEVDSIIADVNAIIFERYLREYIAHSNPDLANSIVTLGSEADAQDFIKNIDMASLPFSQEEYQKIAEDTWKLYFAEMDKDKRNL